MVLTGAGAVADDEDEMADGWLFGEISIGRPTACPCGDGDDEDEENEEGGTDARGRPAVWLNENACRVHE